MPSFYTTDEGHTRNWFTREICSCGYNLKLDPENRLRGRNWIEQTGCPKCHRSFID